MAEFPSAIEALKCALRVQADAGKRNAQLPSDERIDYRMGINAGEIVLQQGRAGGNAVNIAARLEQIADPGGISLSATVYEQVSSVVTTKYRPDRRATAEEHPCARDGVSHSARGMSVVDRHAIAFLPRGPH